MIGNVAISMAMYLLCLVVFDVVLTVCGGPRTSVGVTGGHSNTST